MEKTLDFALDYLRIFKRLSLALVYFWGNTSRLNLQCSQTSPLCAMITFSFDPIVDLDKFTELSV